MLRLFPQRIGRPYDGITGISYPLMHLQTAAMKGDAGAIERNILPWFLLSDLSFQCMHRPHPGSDRRYPYGECTAHGIGMMDQHVTNQ